MDLIVLLLIFFVIASVAIYGWITSAQENTRLRKANAEATKNDGRTGRYTGYTFGQGGPGAGT